MPISFARDPTDLWVRPGFMLFMLGCMETFPCDSFCLFFWWRSRRRRPSSSHHDESRAARTHMHIRTSASPQHTHTHTPAWTLMHVSGFMCALSHGKQPELVFPVDLKWTDFPCQVSLNREVVESHACFQTRPEVIATACRGQPNSTNVHLQWTSHNVSICKVNYQLKMLNSIKDLAGFLLQTGRGWNEAWEANRDTVIRVTEMIYVGSTKL